MAVLDIFGGQTRTGVKWTCQRAFVEVFVSKCSWKTSVRLGPAGPRPGRDTAAAAAARPLLRPLGVLA